MEAEIKPIIKRLADMSVEDRDANDALKYSQAALNLAHVLQVLAQTEYMKMNATAPHFGSP
jgi:predicted transcriptional regulator